LGAHRWQIFERETFHMWAAKARASSCFLVDLIGGPNSLKENDSARRGSTWHEVRVFVAYDKTEQL